jgi:hypothetical protein
MINHGSVFDAHKEDSVARPSLDTALWTSSGMRGSNLPHMSASSPCEMHESMAADIAVVDSLPVAKLPRHIPPGNASAGDIEDRLDNQAVAQFRWTAGLV